MRKLLLVVIMLGTVLGTVVWLMYSPEEETIIPAMEREEAAISCAQPLRHFGLIKAQNGTVSHDFEITNTGKAPLVIVNCEGSCSCITTDWTHQPIPPGGTGNIQVTYNPEGVQGVFIKTIQVVSNASNGNIQLTVRGEVE